MPTDDARPTEASSIDPAVDRRHSEMRLGALLLMGSTVVFAIAGGLVTQFDTPPSQHPWPGMITHGLWFVASALLAVGVFVLVRNEASLRAGLAGYLGAGTLALGALHGLQWATWSYVDVRASAQPEYETVLETITTPFGAGHMLMYAILVGSGTAWIGLAVARHLGARALGTTGAVIGLLTALGGFGSLLAVHGGGSDGTPLFNATILLLPIVFAWIFFLGLSMWRRT